MSAEYAVSVVVPTHLRPQLLTRAAASALGQSHRPLEVLVVDDADDDETRNAVQRLVETADLPDGRLRYLRNREGRGASSSRNVGVDAARGQVVALLDDDDYWAPGYLQRALQRLTTSGVDAVMTWRTKGAGGSRRPCRNPREGLTIRKVIARNPGVSGSNIVIRRDAYRAVGGFDEALPVSNDIDFFVRFLANGCRYAVVDERLVLVGTSSGPRLTDADQRRVDGMRRYVRKHRRTLTLLQHVEMRRRIARANLRRRRDGLPRGWRRALYTAGVIGLSRPEGWREVQRVMALVHDP